MNKTKRYYLPEPNVFLVPMTDVEDVPFAASTATFSLETQFNESLLRLGPAEAISFERKMSLKKDDEH